MVEKTQTNCNNSFTKTICSICYEDLKPIVEDLQSISICGHVFHELCLQQWFEYCTNGKKRNCPVCKQKCATKDVSRLYFQSLGDPNDANNSQKAHQCEESPEELLGEVKRLEGKVSGLGLALEQRNKDLEGVNKEFAICKEILEAEKKLRIKASNEKTTIQQLLNQKSKDLDKSTLECMSLQERNMALAKELAALKLVSDINLDEDEVVKLASLGNEANSKETVDILNKSLIIRNKSYKDLISKCNSLGRGEARSQSKLEKAIAKIGKLKARVLELECAIEAKDNEALRSLKVSRNTSTNVNLQNDFPRDAQISKCFGEGQGVSPAVTSVNVDEVVVSNPTMRGQMKYLKVPNNNNDDDKTASSLDQNKLEKDVILLEEDEDELETSRHPNGTSARYAKRKNMSDVFQIHDLSSTVVSLDEKSDMQEHELGSRENDLGSMNFKNTKEHRYPDVVDDFMHDFEPVQSSFSIRKENVSTVPVAQPGDSCFSGALRGPDGMNWHLGKWCKKGNNESSSKAGDLIAVGADGRGGQIKVLRSLNPSSMDNRNVSNLTKRSKYGVKASGSQSQPPIERFFGRARH
ncbi:hypothetical protein Leryth_011831 [Lithospermum erythrorhizon]|nr:hypothetical protein Leryth_011831 [Lithospermum erythrorhizon]